MDPGIKDQSPTPSGKPEGAEVLEVTSQVAPPSPPKTPDAPPPAAPPGAPSIARPRRPQRSTRVEGSVDILEPKPEPGAETKPKSTPVGPHDDDEECSPDGAMVSHPKRPQPLAAGKSSAGPKALRPKGPGNHPIRAASVPYDTAVRPGPPHPNPHAQRAFSVAGTADTQAQSVEDFRQGAPHHLERGLGHASRRHDQPAGAQRGGWEHRHVHHREVNSMINKRLKDVLFTDQWSEACMDRLSPFGYVLVTSQRMQGVLLLVFAKYYHLPFLRGVQTETTRTGLGGYWGNKGGVSARMSVFGHTVCFLNCHLPAHMENSEQRMEDFESILQQQQFEGQAATAVLDHDVVFWFGDLNFRIDDLEMQVVKSAIESNKLSMLWEKDQLNMAKDSETVLEGFLEGPLKFMPTYKFDVGTDTYDTSGKKRKPAWTDRILWRLRVTAAAGSAPKAGKRASMSGLTSGTKVTQHCYRSHMEYMVSDHKPVSSIFTLQFPYKVDMPLVSLLVEDEWNSVADAIARFTVAPSYARSSWDWIGLYKVGFKHHKDYVGYVWAKQEEADYQRQEHQVTFTEEELPKGSGDFILGFYSNNMNSIVGVTEPFQILLPSEQHDGSASDDSSDFSSEDDSTVVLMKTRSRSPSPSPGQAKRRDRSRSPANPDVKGLNLADAETNAMDCPPEGGRLLASGPGESTSAGDKGL
ncbi:Phosphatidylinositol 4,5-bisphosphate 5-phosphatase A [Merluccius polli]|uniref:Phosphatidylinositol 4,5-bisphosphate 5-phosphatase A n=1 Tax=Merluccius polli TaxID=89951 RepID=A0AA47P4W0_MERPO|nr:Phosphatidylinositol 4,5-bisphosphate 5-phosphatase A [Merluccius polli]